MDEMKDLLKRTEVKRVWERLTKKELCDIYGFHYNFYMNCISGRNHPSRTMETGMREYLSTPTSIVHNKAFALRKRESFHDNLGITEELEGKITRELVMNDVLREPTPKGY